MKVKKIFLLKKDVRKNGKDDNVDIVVELETGKKYIASIFTYFNLNTLKKEHKKTGEFLSGKYFWTNNMLLIETYSKENIDEIIKHLLDEGDFFQVFKRL